jgi:hypothetical protein
MEMPDAETVCHINAFDIYHNCSYNNAPYLTAQRRSVIKPMKTNLTKKYSAIGCCGIDCGLCPRYHTDGKSKCPGCGGIDFFKKHPSCSIITCCAKNKQLETCADCLDFPCGKMKNWDSADSFVTHKNSLVNLHSIIKNGLPAFIRQQNMRIELLERIIENYDDGRSKSFFCLALALLPLNDIKTAIKEITCHKNEFKDKKSIAKFLLLSEPRRP